MRHVVRSFALCTLAAALAPAAVSAQPAPAGAAPAAAPGAPGAPGVPGAPLVPLPTPDAAATELSNKFNAVMKCDGRKDPLRHFCALTRVGKDFIWTPGQPTSYLGLSVVLKTGADLKKTLQVPPTTAVLHLAPASGRVVPVAAGASYSEADRTAVQGGLLKLLATDSKDPTPAPAALQQELRGQVHEGRVPLKQTAENRGFAELAAAAPVRLYRTDTLSGSAFVTVEPTADGQVISVFPVQTAIN